MQGHERREARLTGGRAACIDEQSGCGPYPQKTFCLEGSPDRLQINNYRNNCLFTAVGLCCDARVLVPVNVFYVKNLISFAG